MTSNGDVAKPQHTSHGLLTDLGILDTPPETGFDDIATLAAQICGTPIAYVSFIDGNRQWFKARVGFDMAENTLDRSFCQHALRHDGMLVIPDLTKDARTAFSSLVLDAPHLKFYAGALLKTEDDVVLGTVCVMDVNAHSHGLSAGQENALLALARQVMELLQLRQLLHERAVMTTELNHRLKNTLTIVRSIANQTFSQSHQADALTAFIDRVEALGSAHKILVERDWKSGSFASVAHTTLAPHAAVNQVTFDGPDLNINAVAAVSLSMLLHELATNALKYGALSRPEGKVLISWDVTGREEEALLTLRWQESGGPEVAEPGQKGFGSRLIRIGLAGARNASMAFKPSGLEAEFKVALAVIAVR